MSTSSRPASSASVPATRLAEGFIGDVSLQERNFLGRGQFIRASVQFGESHTEDLLARRN